MHIRTRFVLTASFVAVSLIPNAFAGTQALIKIEQVSPSQYGAWTLLSADGSTRSSSDKGVDKLSYSIGVTEFGPTTISVTEPAGTSVKILVYRGGELIKTVDTPQYSFNLLVNDNYRFLIQYAYTKLGSLGVTSQPSSVRFRLKGPTSKTYNAVTPFTFEKLPAGQYSVIMTSTRKCVAPPPHTALVVPEQRNTVAITLNCDAKIEQKVDNSRKSKRTLVEEVKDRELKPRGERK